mmetsp:Transcript_88081/g.228523  ORF Transcript_88081/g.228523 Transcript_88081/m.228523 type:complete len:88 (-) Transcript_88081:42-305(-)
MTPEVCSACVGNTYPITGIQSALRSLMQFLEWGLLLYRAQRLYRADALNSSDQQCSVAMHALDQPQHVFKVWPQNRHVGLTFAWLFG